MKRIVKLTESDLSKLINRIIKEEKIMEALGGGAYTNEQPNKVEFTNSKVNTLSGEELFPTGSFKVDTKSNAFQTALTGIKGLPDGTVVEVQGGASAVGKKTGFDNTGLAMNRARAFVEALKNSGVKNVSFTILGGKVGESEVKDSPEAKKEQFVKFAIPSELGMNYQIAIDNTAVNKEPSMYKYDGKIPKPKGSNYSMLFEVVYSPDKGQYSADIAATIKDALSGKVVSVTNVTKKYK